MMTTPSNNRAIFEGQNCPTRGILFLFYPPPATFAAPIISCMDDGAIVRDRGFGGLTPRVEEQRGLRAWFQSSRIRSSENNIQLSDGRGRDANVQQATAHRDRESCGHHGIRVVEGVVRVHVTGRQNGTRCTG
jgi:hypothetical protein